MVIRCISVRLLLVIVLALGVAGFAAQAKQERKSSARNNNRKATASKQTSKKTRPRPILAKRVKEKIEEAQKRSAQQRSAQERSAQERSESYDQPDEAAEFFLRKRLPEGEAQLPVERYFAAREQMRQMPQYSTQRNQLLPSRAEVGDESALGEWTALGPGNVGGRTRALLINPANSQVMYAAGVAGGVWKTANGGESWAPLSDMLPNIAVSSMAMDPKNPEVIYAGTGEGFFNSDAVRGAGIFKTTDGGATWMRLESTAGENFNYVNDIVVSSANSQRLYAATRTGVWRSIDGGATWTSVLTPQLSAGCLDLAIRTDQASDFVFASCGSFQQAIVYRNVDAAGQGAWTEVLKDGGMGRTSIAISPSNQNVIYAASASIAGGSFQNGLHAVFRSVNGGEAGSWAAQTRNTSATKLNTVLFSNPLAAFLSECGLGPSVLSSQGWYDNVIAVDPLDPARVWLGGIDLFRSDDGGANWGLASYWWADKNDPHYAHADHHVIAFHPQFNGTANRRMFIGTDGGVFRTDDARAAVATTSNAACNPGATNVTWISLNNNYGVTQFYHGAVFPDGKSYLGGTQDNGTLLGTDATGANGWRELFGGDGGYVAVNPLDANQIFVETTRLSLRKSVDGGRTFSRATLGITEPPQNFLFIAPFVADPSDPLRLWIGGNFLWRTSNGGANWQLAAQGFNALEISAIAIAPTDSNSALAGTSAGFIYNTERALTSDQNTAWPRTSPRNGFVSWLTFAPDDHNIAYATYSTFGGQHVWRSTDGGASWASIDGTGNGALPDLPVHCLAVDPTNTARLYVGTDLGVFVSADSGANWNIERTNFPNTVVETLAINTASGNASLYAFTHGRGVWRVQLGSNVCTYSLAATGQSVPASGGAGGVQINASANGCAWAVQSNASWITAHPSTGTGNGVVTFAIAPNSGFSPRLGTVTIAGQTFTITQAGINDKTQPTIAISSPINTATSGSTFGTGDSIITLRGTASDNIGVSQITWVNDRGGNGTATGASDWRIENLALQSGVNLLTISARDTSGNLVSITLKVIAAPPNLIATVAGGGNGGLGDGGPAIAAEVFPFDLALDGAGNLYIAAAERVRKISPSGIITTVAGGGNGGDGGPATDAKLEYVIGLAADGAGNLYLADPNKHRIRKVDAQTGIITTVAGNGTLGASGDGGQATAASVGNPFDVAVDGAGNLYISSSFRIRKVASNGIITTIAGGGNGEDGSLATDARLSFPYGITLDGSGNIYFADGERVRRIDAQTSRISTAAGGGNGGDGGPATSAKLSPSYVAIDATGNLYITDNRESRVRKVTAGTGIIKTIAGGGMRFPGDGGPGKDAILGSPGGIVVDSLGSIYFSDTYYQRVRKLTAFPTADTSTPAFHVTEPVAASVFSSAQPYFNLGGTATDNLSVTHIKWASDRGPNGQAQLLGNNTWRIENLPLQAGANRITLTAWDPPGNSSTINLVINYATANAINTIAGNRLAGFGGDGGDALEGQLLFPQAVAADGLGNIYIADTTNHRIRRVSPNGVVTTIAGTGLLGALGDNGPAINASLNEPRGVAVDKAGNIYIADTNNHRIRRIAPNGVISTVAGTGKDDYRGDDGLATEASLDSPMGVAVDSSGDLWIADTGNFRVRKVSAATGRISTVAGSGSGFSGDGGPAVQARLNAPTAVAVDAKGDLYIADRLNNRIRKITVADGLIHTIAGDGRVGGSLAGDGDPATQAQLSFPSGVVVDGEGAVYIADTGNHRIRKVYASGIISTVAGDGVPGFSGDGGPATARSLNYPAGVATANGKVYVADTNNHRVAVVTINDSLAGVSAANYVGGALASESIVALFGAYLAVDTRAATTVPLPTSLAGATIKIRDSLGKQQLAPIFFASPSQINFQIPPGTAPGTASLTVLNSGAGRLGDVYSSIVNVATVAPGLFTANSNGQGVAAAVALRIKTDGSQTYEPVAVFDQAQGQFVARPIDLGAATDQVFLILFGTGLRNRSALSTVVAQIGGANAEVLFAGVQGDFVGLDQVNVLLPRSLVGRGDVDIVLTVDGKPANVVRVNIK